MNKRTLTQGYGGRHEQSVRIHALFTHGAISNAVGKASLLS